MSGSCGYLGWNVILAVGSSCKKMFMKVCSVGELYCMTALRRNQWMYCDIYGYSKTCCLFNVFCSYRIRLMMVMMMLIPFLDSCWTWPPPVPPYVVLGSYTFTTCGIATEGNPLLASFSRRLRQAREHSGSTLFTQKSQRLFQ